MKSSSLRLRLLVAWAIFIFIVLLLAGAGLRELFERSILRRTITELSFDLQQLESALKSTADGRIVLERRGPTDPQFDMANGGRYWQLEAAGGQLLRSRSLGDSRLETGSGPRSRFEIDKTLLAPDGRPLVAVRRTVIIKGDDARTATDVFMVSAVNASEIKEDTDKFTYDLVNGLAWVALLLLLGAWIHVTIGLRPLRSVHSELAAIRGGASRRIEGNFPSEVEPLVVETNALLEGQELDLKAARARAGDLAHGLKTPLAIMSAKSRELRRNGIAEIADEIDRQIGVMNRHTQRELARVRARSSQMAMKHDVDISQVVRELVTVIEMLPRSADLQWSLKTTQHLWSPIDRTDLNEMVGNLLDNARKWAKGKVEITASRQGSDVCITVADDGPGIAREDWERVLKRGGRADPQTEGSGLGLSIVADLATIYGGRVTLASSPAGGLTVTILLPQLAPHPATDARRIGHLAT